MYWTTANEKGLTWTRIYEAYGRIIPEMPDIPIGFGPLLDLFYKLSDRRPEGMNGPKLITMESIHAWCEITGKQLGEIALDVLLELDREWMQALNDVKADFKAREETE